MRKSGGARPLMQRRTSGGNRTTTASGNPCGKRTFAAHLQTTEFCRSRAEKVCFLHSLCRNLKFSAQVREARRPAQARAAGQSRKPERVEMGITLSSDFVVSNRFRLSIIIRPLPAGCERTRHSRRISRKPETSSLQEAGGDPKAERRDANALPQKPTARLLFLPTAKLQFLVSANSY